ncbi:ABC transporter permease [Staphylococcus cornubiensis]|uniref:ABC transporter permease n=1 Tax=Staphylococcus cornubiensis TaxID=1986155 RepID=UPI000A389D13|nr:ABC transporter permease [Staphylococcus cornubiensis]
MSILIKQELFKMYKKKSSIIFPIIIVIFMILFAYLSKQYSDIFNSEIQFKTGFSGITWLAFLMIVQASTIITMEFAYGTIKNLLYRKYSRTQIIISKFAALFIYSFILFIGVCLISFLLKFIFLGSLDITSSSGDKMSLIQELALNAVGNYIGLWLILSITLLLSCIMKSPSLSIALGIILYFALSIISGILFMLIDKWTWLKWNPINMLNISPQLLDHESLSKLTHLTNTELFIGNLIYIVLFLVLVSIVFKKKNV